MNIVIKNLSMAYTAKGQGMPLVLVHGYPLNRYMWEPQIDTLAEHARVIAPDLRGHGDSEATRGPYSMDLFADDIKELLDALGISQKVVLCGLSMGGYVSFAFYRKYPERLRGLILAATRAAPDSDKAREGREAAMATATEKGVEAIAAGMAGKMFSPKTAAGRATLLDTADQIMRRTSLEGVLGDLSGLKNRADSTSTLAEIHVPTLILHGTDDQLIPLQDAQRMHASIPGSKLVVIPEAGHLLNMEQPDIFNQALIEFLRTLPPDET